jgi:hypothetical protein
MPVMVVKRTASNGSMLSPKAEDGVLGCGTGIFYGVRIQLNMNSATHAVKVKQSLKPLPRRLPAAK